MRHHDQARHAADAVPDPALRGDADAGRWSPTRAISSTISAPASNWRSAARSSSCCANSRRRDRAGCGNSTASWRWSICRRNWPGRIGRDRRRADRHAGARTARSRAARRANFRPACAPCSRISRRARRSATSPFRRCSAAAGGRCRASRSATRDGVLLGWRGVGSDITDAAPVGRRCGARGAARSADRARQPPAGARTARGNLAHAMARASATAGCCWSISTASSWSTTRSAMRSATNCWSKSRAGSKRRSARAAGSGGSAATNSRSCGTAMPSRDDARPRSPSGSSPTLSRSFHDRRRQPSHRRDDRHRPRPRRRRARGAIDAQRRPRPVSRQGRRARRLCLLRTLHVRRGRGSPPARK